MLKLLYMYVLGFDSNTMCLTTESFSLIQVSRVIMDNRVTHKWDRWSET